MSDSNQKSNLISQILFKVIRKVKRLLFLANVSFRIVRTMGLRVFVKKLRGFIITRLHVGEKVIDLNSEYPLWLKKVEFTEDDYKAKKELITSFILKPLISVVIPVYNVEEIWLRKAVDSVKSQIYENWELCIVDDASTQQHIKPLLEKISKEDTRIKVKYCPVNQHISLASNEGIKLATGEFVTFLDNDDELAKNALYEFVKVYNKFNGELDFVYSDEDLIETDDSRLGPIFKPDWSPETNLSMMFTTHIAVYRKSIIDEIGGFRKGFEGSQDHDLVSRFTEKTTANRIYHIPLILYHWRRVPGSTSTGYEVKPYTREASRRSILDTIARRKMEGELVDGLTAPSFHIKRKIRNNPKVSIIIPARDKVNYLKKLVDSIERETICEGFSYEIVLVDNDSVEPEALKYFDEISAKHKVLRYPYPFNYSAINNFAVDNCDGDYLLFLNNDMSVINKEWLYELVQLVQEKEIGAVGARLLFANDTIQHAGVYLHKDGVGGHIFRDFWKDVHGYMDRILITSNVSAVTGACLMMRREVFEEIGRFDQENLPVAFNDVDLCLKSLKAGYRNLYTPFAILYHYESISRGPEDTPEKIKRFNKEWNYMFTKWKNELQQDKYWNPNLILNNGVLSLNFEVKKEI